MHVAAAAELFQGFADAVGEDLVHAGGDQPGDGADGDGQHGELEEENTQLKEVIEKGSAENSELRKKLRIKELEDTSADDLKVLLTEQGIPFGARDSKAALIELLNADSD